MKIRSTFVSNSSSCSFMAVGYLIKEDERTKEILKELLTDWNLMDEIGLDYFGESTAQKMEKGMKFVGRNLVDIDLDDWKSVRFKISEIQEIAEEVKKVLNDREIYMGEPLVIAGVKNC